MSLMPRVLGGLCALWAARWGWFVVIGWRREVIVLALAAGVLWAAAAVQLFRGELIGAWLAAGLALLEQFALSGGSYSGARELLFWVAVIVALTDRHDHERALLLRVCVTAVYAFTAVSKLNPAWLAGDDLVRIATSTPQLTWLVDVVSSPAGVWLAALVVIVELWIPIGLWWARTRGAAALSGAVFHTLLIVGAATSVWGAFNLLVLNLGLLVLYPAFWAPLRPTRRAERREPAHAG